MTGNGPTDMQRRLLDLERENAYLKRTIRNLRRGRLRQEQVTDHTRSLLKQIHNEYDESLRIIERKNQELERSARELDISFLELSAAHGKLKRETFERNEAERTLRRSERKYHSLFENMLTGFAYLQVVYQSGAPVDFVFLEANTAYGRQTGLPTADIIGRRFSELVSNSSSISADWIRTFGDLAKHGGDLQRELYSEELGKWFLLSAYSIEYGYFAVILMDISERKQAEQELRRSESRLKHAQYLTLTGSYECDLGGGETVFTEQLYRILGYDLEDSPPGSLELVAEHVHPADRKVFLGKLDFVKRHSTSLQGEFRVIRRDDAIIPVKALLESMPGEDGHPTSVFGTFQDISEQKQMQRELLAAKEEAEGANRSKSQFLATMSHEIRTPINAIKGMAELTQGTNLDPKQRGYVDIVRESSEHLLNVINEILEFSRIEDNKLVLEHDDFDLRRILGATCQILESMALEKGLALALEIAPELPSAFRGDARRLRQIVFNLAGNAIKFTDAGSVRIRVASDRAAGQTSAGQAVRLLFSIEDTGIGIPESERERIFEKFTQVDSSTTRQYGGTGLGLAITQRLVEMMQGTIWVESEPGAGSAFFFTVELEHGDDAEIRRRRLEEEGPAVEIEGIPPLRILLAEDEPFNVILTRTVLAKQGHAVTVAENGPEALAALARDVFDLVLMDIEMPGMDGIEATRRIRAGDCGDRNREIPIFALTAHVLPEFVTKCREAAMNAYVTKPINFRKLSMYLSRTAKGERLSIQPRPRREPRRAPDAVLNLEAMRDQFDGDDETPRILYANFREKSATMLDPLRRAVEDRFPEAIAKAAHYIKSSLIVIHAETSYRIAGEIESAARGEDLSAVRELMPKLAAELERLMPILGLVLEQPAASDV